MTGILRNLNKSKNGKRVLGTPYVGKSASAIPAHSASYPDGLLTNKISAGDASDTLYKVIVGAPTPTGLVLLVQEDGSFQATGADGSYSGALTVWKYSRSNGISNDTGSYSATITASGGTVATTPDAPTIGAATAGNGAVSVAFTAPTNNGSAITGYIVDLYRASDSTHLGQQSGTSSPISIASPNGTAVYTTVSATNSAGEGAASAHSNTVTPQVPSTLPDVTMDASLIPKHRWISFAGNTRVVSFAGNTRTIRFDGNNRVIPFD